MPFKWFLFVSLIRPVVELVDLPLPNTLRNRLTARLLLFAKIPSSVFVPFALFVAAVVVDGVVDCSRRHLSRPRIRSIKFELVNRNNSSLFGSTLGCVTF